MFFRGHDITDEKWTVGCGIAQSRDGTARGCTGGYTTAEVGDRQRDSGRPTCHDLAVRLVTRGRVLAAQLFVW